MGGGGTVKEVKSKAELEKLLVSEKKSALILHFWASWCEASKQMDQVFSHLSTDFPHAQFLRVEAEEQPEISEAYSVATVPYFVFFKGKPDEPRCGFSRKVVEILRQEKLDFNSFDILTDDDVRQGLKVYSNWSSYPQLYIKGELIGGSDIVVEMQKSGELSKVLAEKGIPHGNTLEVRLKQLITSSPVMLFMKGTPDAPRCGFSSKVVNALQEEGVEFGSFDILTDDEVRQGLKAFSNWPTFPQLYYKGEFTGGCDIVLELKSNGELKATLSE